MWFSPGMILGGVFIWLVYEFTGKTSFWWCWLIALGICVVVDVLLHVVVRDVPKVKTQRVYTRK